MLFCFHFQATLSDRSLDGSTPLILAAKFGHSTVVKLLLANRSDQPSVEAKDSSGNNALHLAAAGGHEATVDALLKAGASQTIKNGDGRTPPELARDNGHERLALLMAFSG